MADSTFNSSVQGTSNLTPRPTTLETFLDGVSGSSISTPMNFAPVYLGQYDAFLSSALASVTPGPEVSAITVDQQSQMDCCTSAISVIPPGVSDSISDRTVLDTCTSQQRFFVCQHCNKPFRQRTAMLQHERIHTGERPYPCHFCEKRFKQLCHRAQHERIHTGAKPYSCNMCLQTFRQKNHLDSHLRKHYKEITSFTFADVPAVVVTTTSVS